MILSWKPQVRKQYFVIACLLHISHKQRQKVIIWYLLGECCSQQDADFICMRKTAVCFDPHTRARHRLEFRAPHFRLIRT